MKNALTFTATAVVEAEIGDALGVAGVGQRDLLGRVAVGQQAVATDDHRGGGNIGHVQGTGELVAVGVELDGLLVVQGSLLRSGLVGRSIVSRLDAYMFSALSWGGISMKNRIIREKWIFIMYASYSAITSCQ